MERTGAAAGWNTLCRCGWWTSCCSRGNENANGSGNALWPRQARLSRSGIAPRTGPSPFGYFIWPLWASLCRRARAARLREAVVLLRRGVDLRTDFDFVGVFRLRATECLRCPLVAAVAGRIKEARRQKIKRMRLVMVFPNKIIITRSCGARLLACSLLSAGSSWRPRKPPERGLQAKSLTPQSA